MPHMQMLGCSKIRTLQSGYLLEMIRTSINGQESRRLNLILRLIKVLRKESLKQWSLMMA